MEKIVKRKRRIVRYNDFTLAFLIYFVCAIGLVIIYSSSAYIARNKNLPSTYFLLQQLKAIGVGTILMIFISQVLNYRIFRYKIFQFRARLISRTILGKKNIKIGVAHLVLLLATCIQLYTTFFAEEKNGARRWIEIKGIGSVQPSEFAKFAVIIFAAYVCYRYPRSLSKFIGFIYHFLWVLPLILLIAKENLSSAIIVAGIFVVICFVTSDKYAYFVFFVLFSGFSAFLLIERLGGFRSDRIAIFKNIEGSPKGEQILQGLYAIASSDLIGKGLGGSEQKYGRVPEAYNDMIFSIICEELGLFGAVAVVILFIFILVRMLIIVRNIDDRFGALIGIGIMAQISIQLILNIAVVTNMIPSTGVPLPFISYGGTSVIMLLCEIGVLLNISKQIEYEA